MKLGRLEDALEVLEGGHRQAYTSKWKGKSVWIWFEGSPLLKLFLGHAVIDADQLQTLLNAAYFEGYTQRIREEF